MWIEPSRCLPILILLTLSVRPTTALAEGDVTAESILRRQVEVTGAEALTRHENRYLRWDAEFSNGLTGTMETWVTDDDETYSRFELGDIGVFLSGVYRGIAWSYDERNGATLESGDKAKRLLLEADFDGEADPERFERVELIGTTRFAERKAYEVEVTLARGLFRTHFYDVKTGVQLGWRDIGDNGQEREAAFPVWMEVDDGLLQAGETVLGLSKGEMTMYLDAFSWDVGDLPSMKPPKSVLSLYPSELLAERPPPKTSSPEAAPRGADEPEEAQAGPAAAEEERESDERQEAGAAPEVEPEDEGEAERKPLISDQELQAEIGRIEADYREILGQRFEARDAHADDPGLRAELARGLMAVVYAQVVALRHGEYRLAYSVFPTGDQSSGNRLDWILSHVQETDTESLRHALRLVLSDPTGRLADRGDRAAPDELGFAFLEPRNVRIEFEWEEGRGWVLDRVDDLRLVVIGEPEPITMRFQYGPDDVKEVEVPADEFVWLQEKVGWSERRLGTPLLPEAEASRIRAALGKLREQEERQFAESNYNFYFRFGCGERGAPPPLLTPPPEIVGDKIVLWPSVADWTDLDELKEKYEEIEGFTSDLSRALEGGGDSPLLVLSDTSHPAETRSEATVLCEGLEYKGLTGWTVAHWIEGRMSSSGVVDFHPSERYVKCGLPFPEAEALAAWLATREQEVRDDCSATIDAMGFK